MLRTVGLALRDLVLPAACGGCGRPGSVLCRVCRPGGPPLVVDPVGELPVWAAARYEAGIRAALIAYKEHERRDLGAPLGGLLRSAIGTGDALVVPVPSAREAIRRRGGDHVVRLTRAATRGTGHRIVPALHLCRSVQDSAGLRIDERRANLAGAMAARPAPNACGPVVVVDDIVTTGATLAEAIRALRCAGWPVTGAAVVAATPRRRTADPLPAQG